MRLKTRKAGTLRGDFIKEADPDVVEEWKWMGTPIWSHDGIICTGESYKNALHIFLMLYFV
jgi:hypothetical protein